MSNHHTSSKPLVQVSLYETERKIYPRSVTGRYSRWRWAMVWLTQLVFYGLPWLPWNDRQAVLFDLDRRLFYIFGLVLQPQDFIYLAVLLVLSALGLFFFTAVAGRVWCGYACPQTVYTEIFLWVERLTEGDRVARMRLDAQPWSVEKVLRKTAKQLGWMGIALFTGLTFTGYFIPMGQLIGQIWSASASPWALFWVGFYGFATYGNAGFMREQVCKYMCPYARFQSALIDMDSMVIAYDRARGEPRGGRSRKTDSQAVGLGDCIDCTLCVQVCPTGIDIRNGLQNECIACAACIDVCDDVMDKMGYAPGLIRYSSGHGVEQGLSKAQMMRRIWRPRVLIYGALLLAVATGFVLSLFERTDFSVSVTKDRGALARVVGLGDVENTYTLQISNNSEHDRVFVLSVKGMDGLQLDSDNRLHIGATDTATLPIRLRLPARLAQAHAGEHVSMAFHVRDISAGHQTQELLEKGIFLVPVQ